MKKTLIYALAASVAVLASCAKEATVKEAPAKETVPCTISFGVDTTKSYMNSSGITWWTKGDQISVFSDQGTRKTFTSTLSSSAASSDFTCEDWVSDEIPEWAVFCYEEKATPYKPYNVTETTEGVFAANVSCYQPITVRNMGSFGSKANISVAKITNNQGTYSGQMKNALGLVKITIPSGVQNVNEIILEDAAGTAPIAGNVTINYTGDDPVCTPTGENGKSSISAKCNISGATAFTAGKSVYFCVIPGVSFTPKFTFVTVAGFRAIATGNKAISVSRNKYFECGTPESLDFIEPVGYVKDTVNINLSIKQPFNEPYASATSQKGEGVKKDADYTYTNNAGNTYTYTLCGSGVDGAYTYASAKKELQFSAKNEPEAYIELKAPEGGYIASFSFDTRNGKTKQTYSITDTTDGSEKIIATAPETESTVDVDLRNTFKEISGCKIIIDEGGLHSFRALRITYFIPEETE